MKGGMGDREGVGDRRVWVIGRVWSDREGVGDVKGVG